MDKISKILIEIIVVLIIIFIIVFSLYTIEKKKASKNFNTILDYAMETYNTNKKISEVKEQIEKLNIRINQIQDIVKLKLDVKSEIMEIEELSEELYDFISYVNIPNNLKLESVSKVYTRNVLNRSYDILHDYVFNLKDEKDNDISIAVSNIENPVKDIKYTSEEKISQIDNQDVSIYNYEERYIAEMESNGKYILVSATGITEEQLIEILRSIISYSKN